MSDTPETDALREAIDNGAATEAEMASLAKKLERERDQWREIARIAVAARDHNRAMWDKCAAELDEILKSDK